MMREIITFLTLLLLSKASHAQVIPSEKEAPTTVAANTNTQTTNSPKSIGQSVELFDLLATNFAFNPNDFEDLQEEVDEDFDEEESNSHYDYPQKYIGYYEVTSENPLDRIQHPHDPDVHIEKPNIFQIVKAKRKPPNVPSPIIIADSMDHAIHAIGNHEHFKSNNSGLDDVTLPSDLHPNSISQHTPTGMALNRKLDEKNQFYQLTLLFDQFLWDGEAIVRNSNISTECGGHMQNYLSSLHVLTPWAVKASDSSGRYGGKLIFGNEFWLGSKQFCREINLQYHNHSDFISLDYSVAIIMFNMNGISKKTRPLSVGQCLPRTCSTADIENILKLDAAFRKLSIGISKSTANTTPAANTDFLREFRLKSIRKVPGPYRLLAEKKFYALCAICLVIFSAMFVATYFEDTLIAWSSCDEYQNPNRMKMDESEGVENGVSLRCEKIATGLSFELYQTSVINNNLENGDRCDERKMQHECKKLPKFCDFFIKLLLCFSITSNSRRILSIEKLSEGSISCIHGLRTISLLWIVMVHACLQLYAISNNKYDRKIAERHFLYQMVGNATYSVDTFFFISGLLVALMYFRTRRESDGKQTPAEFIKSGTTKSFLLIVYRYLRLTPAYFFVVVMVELSLKYMTNASVFNPEAADSVMCERYWWRNILYINNWFSLREFCMIWSWYLANDMQLYIIAITLLIFSVRYFKFCAAALLTLLFSSWVVSAYFSFHHNYTHKVAEPFESFDFLYDKPWQRVGPYAIGMITAYIYHNVKTPPKISLATNLILWTLSLATLFLVLFGVWNGRLSVIGTAFYVSLGHTGWGLGLVWIVLSCCWGLAEPVNKLLSYPILYPFSRLTYCAYLVHPLIQIVTKHNIEGSLHLDPVFVFLVFIGTGFVSYVAAFFISISFEAPMLRILKLVFKK